MLRLPARRAGSIARTLLGSSSKCTVDQKANMVEQDFGRVGLLQPNLDRPAVPSLEERMANWKEVSDIFYGPERDLKNYPNLKQKVDVPKVRYMFFPESFFETLYTKTGILGPYLLLWGTPAYLFSKEHLKFDYEWTCGLFVAVPGYIIYSKINKDNRVVKILEEKQKEMIKDWHQPILDVAKHTDRYIEVAKTSIYQQEVLEYIFEVKKDNVALQLELEYRQRLKSLYNQVKRKLDYQVAFVNAKKNFEQGHMATWINKAVYSSITPQLEKQVMESCFANLRELSKNFKAT